MSYGGGYGDDLYDTGAGDTAIADAPSTIIDAEPVPSTIIDSASPEAVRLADTFHESLSRHFDAAQLDPRAQPVAETLPALRNHSANGAERSAITPQVVAERVPVPDDTDGLTKQTIDLMCRYIREGAVDPLVCQAMDYAARVLRGPMAGRFGLAWGCYWFVKHRIRRKLDEAALWRLGAPGAADMLTAPAVLMRMGVDAAEDCDGFTMLELAMLSALKACGIELPLVIVTVACDGRDRSRWSHVFGMIQLENGEWLPLDCSHGTGPGWMVPRHQIFRWQAWDLDGNPVNVAPPVRSMLRGYVPSRAPMGARSHLRRRRGMGSTGLGMCYTDDSGNVVACDSTPDQSGSTSTLSFPQTGGAPVPQTPINLGAPVQLGTTPGTASWSTGAGFNWNNLITSLVGGATRVASIAELPAGASLTPSGQVIGSPLALTGGMGNILMWGAVALVGFALISSLGKK